LPAASDLHQRNIKPFQINGLYVAFLAIASRGIRARAADSIATWPAPPPCIAIGLVRPREQGGAALALDAEVGKRETGREDENP
jgi:hypothetical protein